VPPPSGDRLDFRQVRAQGVLERRHEVLGPDVLERRQP